jgi:adenylosuccinate lyase
MEIEAEVMRELGLGKPDTADWKGSRDRFAEFGAALAIAARTYGRIAQEVFLLQGDDIAELDEANPGIGSSTMPHKSNPTLCIEIVSRSREVSAELSPLLEWMMTIYERDSAQQGESLRRMCEGYGILLDNMKRLAARLRVHPENMRRNLLRTKGLVLAEDITFRLAKAMGKKTAHALMHGLMQRAAQSGLGMREILESEPDIAGKLQVDLADLDPTRYIGEAVRITEATIASIQARRVKTQET